MIVCEDLGVVFFHNPHAGGRTISRWLKGHCGGKRFGHRHGTEADPSLSVRIAVWRDPVERFQSMYVMKHRQGKYQSIDHALKVLLSTNRRAFIPQAQFFQRCGITHRFEFPVFHTIAELDCFRHVSTPIEGWHGKTADAERPSLTSGQIDRLLEFEAS